MDNYVLRFLLASVMRSDFLLSNISSDDRSSYFLQFSKSFARSM